MFGLPPRRLLNVVYCLLLDGVHDREGYDALQRLVADDDPLTIRERALARLEG